VEVRQIGAQRRLFALASFAPGVPVIALAGDVTSRPSRYSVQIGHGQHIDLPTAAAVLSDDILVPLYPWRFLNHSCRPNAVLRGREFVALAPISPGDEITFDYNTTEYEMAEPFTCECGTCDGRLVGGFVRLSPAERTRLAPFVAPHLRPFLGHGGASRAG
jgi:hypothetical protein